VLGAASFCALGVAVASVISNAEAAPAVAQLVLFPLLFVSGTYIPIHSALLNRISGWLPVRHLAVLAAWGGAGALVAVRRLRFEPRPE
jgi:ABC-2 type transport system permease protein